MLCSTDPTPSCLTQCRKTMGSNTYEQVQLVFGSLSLCDIPVKQVDLAAFKALPLQNFPSSASVENEDYDCCIAALTTYVVDFPRRTCTKYGLL